ncbi:Ubiquitin-conjugating enzyme, E2 domain and Ubiquitin-conjugating enzyme/RWD-like domain-containing protein [Strongyloides ratti]|uniref:Ubiquitin-conjugating enzyme, E2 domain and Ubiquitin-conjugating enzyme/RWD-like domain-containing protein n=1 Tax=Strongyloides ratti TaxID=34506 RepID=A0A090MZV9_STRRB|nr:Ubiquitin-conjugating enzyme, E2 domain and Ubiquitin-conjugating enzyme/RWD-like domain-containing protein [Strongyloides ratti]CEF69615.1 Ubiquitin-conjugating enzyme, E2 domain and Ubiquitin-conjugating enzyme/RWD-like domain-containing protein [Strongyloides ratti]
MSANNNKDESFFGKKKIFALVNGSRAVILSTGMFIGRAVMGTATSTIGNQNTEEEVCISERLLRMLDQKPLKMATMLKLTRIVNDATPEEKIEFFNNGVIKKVCTRLIEEGDLKINNYKGLSKTNSNPENMDKRKQKKRHNSITSLAIRGIGYGTGSTRSRWDVEKAIEERITKEEHIIWLLNALTAFLYKSYNDTTSLDITTFAKTDFSYLKPEICKEIYDTKVLMLFDYHLTNDSIFDISERVDLFEAIFETISVMSMIPNFVQYIVYPLYGDGKSISKELIPTFRHTLQTYPNLFKRQMITPDYRLIEFIKHVEKYSKMIMNASREFETLLPVEERIKTSIGKRNDCEESRLLTPKVIENIFEVGKQLTPENIIELDKVYSKVMSEWVMQSYRFVDNDGKLIVPFTYAKDVKNVNPFAGALRERTKRIAKELASMVNSLPQNASNSIFVCVDESRCDIIKVLISGPDDTPYENGLFEFDVFFPTSYPFSPPKCSFLTTGNGNVRFNPNLYNDGKICLSILGTWEGRPEEKWSPYCSLLQVLISIQGLIFVKEPYFNEPGFEKYRGTEKGDSFSKKYNLQIEHATITYAIRDQIVQPSKHFESVIKRHFWLKRHAIIKQAHRWVVEMRKEIADMNKPTKKRDSFCFDTVYNPVIQEKVIQQLISELTNMKCPIEVQI